MADQPAPQNLAADDIGLDTLQLKAILAQSTQKRATQMVREAEQQFAQERQQLQQQIEVMKATLQEKDRLLTEEKARGQQLDQAIADEKARGQRLDQTLAELSSQLQSREALSQTYQQFESAIAGLNKGRSDLLAIVQRQQDEIGDLLAAQTGELELRLRELVLPSETPKPAITPPPPVRAPIPPSAAVEEPEPQEPPTTPSKQMALAGVLARARAVTPAPAPPTPVSTSTMGMAEINEWMSGARQKKTGAEPAPAAGQTMMMKALTPEQIQQVQNERLQQQAPPQTERRRLPRRAGNPVNVSIEGPGDPPEALQGQVLDRTQAGVGLRLGKAQPVGTILKLRAGQNKWIEAEVRFCIRDGNSFRAGCQFAKRYPWGDLQQFG